MILEQGNGGIERHPEWSAALADEADHNIVRDVALIPVRPATDIPRNRALLQSLAYPRLPRLDDPVVHPGIVGTVVGYGLPKDADGLFVRRYGEFTVGHVGGTGVLNGFSYSGPGLQIASGDSGGPFFLENDGLVLAGINSTLIHGTAWAANVTASSTAAWLDQTIKKLAPDSDGDGIPDVCDNCPSSANQTDSDGDLIPDDCDPCPCDPAWIEGNDDPDDDKVCNHCDPTLSAFCGIHCQTAILDNCPTNKNPEQKNCNHDAEIAREAEVLGDACDPVPCPKGEPEFTSSTVWSHHGLISTGVTTHRLERFEITKVRPRDTTHNGYPTFGTITNAADYRYCNRILSPTINCSDNTDAIVSDDLLRTGLTAATENANHPWRRVKMAGLSLNARDFSDDARGYDFCSGEGIKNLPPTCTESYPRTWDYPSDFARWEWATPLPGLPTTAPIGRFWFHTESPLGTSDPQIGVHERIAGGPAESLTNHYVPILPERVVVSNWAGATPWHPYLWVLHCPQCEGVAKPWAHLIDEIFLIAPIDPQLQNRFGALTHEGAFEDVTDSLGPSLIDRLADPTVRWLTPVEPHALVGRGVTFPLALGIAADGTSVVDAVRSDGRRLLGNGDRPIDVVDWRAESSSLPDLPFPEPREGFVGVMSRMVGGFFLVGGQQPGGGTLRQDVWFHNLSSGQWLRVPISVDEYAPQRVLAATYAFGDEHLWVLDEVRSGKVWKRRLVRIRPSNGAVHIVGEWTSARLFDRHWLRVDADGAVLLAASSSKLTKHVLVRLVSEDGQVRVDGLHAGNWDLMVEPGVDSRGITLVKRSHPTKGPRVERVDHVRAPGAWGWLPWCLR